PPMQKLLCILLAFILAVPFAHGAEFFVAPNGDDTNPGTLEKPFATLPRAQEAARKAIADGKVIVKLRGGVYYLRDTLVLTKADSSTRCTRRCGAECTTSSRARTRRATSLSKAAGRTTARRKCTRNTVSSKTFSRNSTHPASGSST